MSITHGVFFWGKPLTKGRSRLGLLCMQFFQNGGETKKQTKKTIGHLTMFKVKKKTEGGFEEKLYENIISSGKCNFLQ